MSLPNLPEWFIYFNEVYSLKERKAVFLERQNLIFSVVAGSILFLLFFFVVVVVVFRPNTFTIKISNWGQGP